MNRSYTRQLFLCGLGFALLCAVSLTAPAQTSQEVQILKGKVVYVSGNDLVVKMQDGAVRHFDVAPGRTFTVDGRDMTVSDLKPGMELTATITTTTTEKTVSNVRTVTGKVFQVHAPYVIMTLPDGTNRQVKVPDGTKFNIDGQEKTVFELKPGMKFSATVVTKTPETVVSRNVGVTGTAPPPPAPVRPVETPPMVGVLLVEEVKAPAPVQTARAEQPPAPAPEPAPERLPQTASPVPLVGLLGMLSLSAGLALRFARRR